MVDLKISSHSLQLYVITERAKFSSKLFKWPHLKCLENVVFVVFTNESRVLCDDIVKHKYLVHFSVEAI
jgi:hypothetical protein